MSTEILNGVIDGPYLADDGDIIIVSGDALVRSDQSSSGAIDIRTLEETNISVIVDGRIRNTGDFGDGIRFFGTPADNIGDHLIHIRESGVVTGYNGITLGNGQNSSIIVAGQVKGDYAGINTTGTDFNYNITGKVFGDYSSAMFIDQGHNSVVNNFGQLSSNGAGVLLNDSNDTSIINSGHILGGHGILATDSLNNTILNSGVIKSPNPTVMVGEQTLRTKGIELLFVESFHLDNSGRIEGGYAVDVSGSNGTIVNSGKMIGQFSGLYLGPGLDGPGVAATIDNSGLIKGELSAYIYSGPVHITNSGIMDGDIFARNAQVTLINSGKIKGNVKLDYHNDIYQATDDGFVTRFVFGGDGNDLLTGASRADTLRGGTGDDMVTGHGGKDTLRGGSGDDLITGGADDDILTGGGGKDVFVFEMNAGNDRIEDFKDGKDILRLKDHAGGFASLTISDVGADLKIIHDGGEIILTGEAGTVLSSADFDFI